MYHQNRTADGTSMAGAEYLQSIFGTEKDRVNCPFYFKIGACRHGDKCERRHNKPPTSQTLLVVGMYRNPALVNPGYDEKKGQDEFEEFYEDIYDELSNYGTIDELNVCDNICDHLAGNVYVKFAKEDGAEKALHALTGRFYGGRPIVGEFSPVTDFREASCRQYEMRECTRGGHCNFMHLKQVSRELQKKLFGYSGRRGGGGREHTDRPREEKKDDYKPRDNRGGGRYDPYSRGDRDRGHDRDRRGGGDRYDDRRGGGGDRYDDRRGGGDRYDDRRGGGGERYDDRRGGGGDRHEGGPRHDDRERYDRGPRDDRGGRYEDRHRDGGGNRYEEGGNPPPSHAPPPPQGGHEQQPPHPDYPPRYEH